MNSSNNIEENMSALFLGSNQPNPTNTVMGRNRRNRRGNGFVPAPVREQHFSVPMGLAAIQTALLNLTLRVGEVLSRVEAVETKVGTFNRKEQLVQISALNARVDAIFDKLCKPVFNTEELSWLSTDRLREELVNREATNDLGKDVVNATSHQIQDEIDSRRRTDAANSSWSEM